MAIAESYKSLGTEEIMSLDIAKSRCYWQVCSSRVTVVICQGLVLM